MSADVETEEGHTGICWCGERHAWFSDSDLDDQCGGSGELPCYCGGDLCVCHNHGAAECYGCEDCEGYDDDFEDDYDYYD